MLAVVLAATPSWSQLRTAAYPRRGEAPYWSAVLGWVRLMPASTQRDRRPQDFYRARGMCAIGRAIMTTVIILAGASITFLGLMPMLGTGLKPRSDCSVGRRGRALGSDIGDSLSTVASKPCMQTDILGGITSCAPCVGMRRVPARPALTSLTGCAAGRPVPNQHEPSEESLLHTGRPGFVPAVPAPCGGPPLRATASSAGRRKQRWVQESLVAPVAQ